MKSKSFDLKPTPPETTKSTYNKTLDFIHLYNTPETSKLGDKSKTVDDSKKSNLSTKLETPNRVRSFSKNKKKPQNELLDLSHINIDGSNLAPNMNSPVHTKATSTPYTNEKGKSQLTRVKSIMKNNSYSHDDTMEGHETPHKPKKRNKSVSFMLEDNEEVVIKKTKSEDSLKDKKEVSPKKNAKNDRKKDKSERNRLNKFKKNQAEKENKLVDANNINSDNNMETTSPGADAKGKKIKKKAEKQKSEHDNSPKDTAENQEKKKFKKNKKRKNVDENPESTEPGHMNGDTSSQPKKKLKKKKPAAKPAQAPDTEASSGKTDVKPEIIEKIENLSIGDNAHTLTNLLDDMTVAEKNKRKKIKRKIKKDKKPLTKASSGESQDLDKENASEGKEKVKWKKRKWNKDKKGDLGDDNINTSIIVENLPLSMMLTYKKVLAEHFAKCGLIKKIGIAEMYPTEVSKPVFTTSINFYSDGAATQALEDDGTVLEGSRIHVKRPLPPTETTLVVRSYADMSEQSLTTLFTGAGRIRSIRHLVKGKKAISTAFIEFDGPEAVKRAMEMSREARIEGKKIHVTKFEQRKPKKETKTDQDSENEGGSEDSND